METELEKAEKYCPVLLPRSGFSAVILLSNKAEIYLSTCFAVLRSAPS
jgi:hypothetical protein